MHTVITPPAGVEVIETYASTYWFNKDGILYAISKKVHNIPDEEAIKQIEVFKKLTKGKKVCIMGDATNRSPINKKTRDFAATEFPKVVKAMALVSSSAMGRMVIQVFLKLKPPSYPVKMFAGEHEAKEWLKQYL